MEADPSFDPGMTCSKHGYYLAIGGCPDCNSAHARKMREALKRRAALMKKSQEAESHVE